MFSFILQVIIHSHHILLHPAYILRDRSYKLHSAALGPLARQGAGPHARRAHAAPRQANMCASPLQAPGTPQRGCERRYHHHPRQHPSIPAQPPGRCPWDLSLTACRPPLSPRRRASMLQMGLVRRSSAGRQCDCQHNPAHCLSAVTAFSDYTLSSEPMYLPYEV